MEDFIKFRKMITPVIIQILFWVGVAGSILGGLVTMFMSFNAYNGGAMVFVGGLAMIIFGPIAVRIYCELLILLFRMNETLTDIKTSLAKK